jgi:transposase
LTDIHHQGRRPGKDVHHGDHGKDEAPPSVVLEAVKAEVVDLVRQPGNCPTSVARDLDLTESALRGWVRQAEIDVVDRDGLTSAEREELFRLRKENRVLREERDILKRATAFFARETR